MKTFAAIDVKMKFQFVIYFFGVVQMYIETGHISHPQITFADKTISLHDMSVVVIAVDFVEFNLKKK